METKNLVENGVYVFEKARALQLSLQYMSMDWVLGFVPGTKRVERRRDFKSLRELQQGIDELLHRDAKLFSSGTLPLSMLLPAFSRDELKNFWKLYPRLVIDGFKLYKRRSENRNDDFSEKSSKIGRGLPEYYRRNFHFQSEGYLSEESALLYDYQVDLLFAGTSNAMRRLMVEPILELMPKEHVGDGRGLQVLELGCGTGSATPIVATLFPNADIKALDLSAPYLRVARRRLASHLNVHPLRGDAADLPFQDARFDLIFSSFVFHELPLEVRKSVLAEAFRALKPGGALILVDSVQKGDSKVFDPLLEDFPKNFHEPFFKNYTLHPLKDLLRDAGFEVRHESVGFASKCVSAVKGEKASLHS